MLGSSIMIANFFFETLNFFNTTFCTIIGMLDTLYVKSSMQGKLPAIDEN